MGPTHDRFLAMAAEYKVETYQAPQVGWACALTGAAGEVGLGQSLEVVATGSSALDLPGLDRPCPH